MSAIKDTLVPEIDLIWKELVLKEWFYGTIQLHTDYKVNQPCVDKTNVWPHLYSNLHENNYMFIRFGHATWFVDRKF